MIDRTIRIILQSLKHITVTGSQIKGENSEKNHTEKTAYVVVF